MTLKVVSAAVMANEMVFSKPAPCRHHHVLNSMSIDFGLDAMKLGIPENQGFVLSDGTFAGRTRGAKVALAAGQIEKLNWPPYLYSEDLW